MVDKKTVRADLTEENTPGFILPHRTRVVMGDLLDIARELKGEDKSWAEFDLECMIAAFPKDKRLTKALKEIQDRKADKVTEKAAKEAEAKAKKEAEAKAKKDEEAKAKKEAEAKKKTGKKAPVTEAAVAEDAEPITADEAAADQSETEQNVLEAPGK